MQKNRFQRLLCNLFRVVTYMSSVSPIKLYNKRTAQACITCLQFFHEVDESGCWMRDDIRKLFYAFNETEIRGEFSDGQTLYAKLQVRILK